MFYGRVDSLCKEDSRFQYFSNTANNGRTVKPQLLLLLEIQSLCPWLSYNTIFSLEHIYQFYSISKYCENMLICIHLNKNYELNLTLWRTFSILKNRLFYFSCQKKNSLAIAVCLVHNSPCGQQEIEFNLL